MLKKYIKNIISVFLCVCVCFTAFFTATLGTDALAYPCKGEVINERAQVWTLAGTKTPGSKYVEDVKAGETIQILKDAIDGDGDRWYYAKYGPGFSKEGYFYSGRVKIVADYSADDGDFEKWLNTQHFPESYKPGLRALHSLYPNWVFHADITNLDFETAVNNEYAGDGKFAYYTSSDAEKSMDKGYYDWDKNKYVYTEGSSWVKASKSSIRYYMDPRNFFNTRDVFIFLSQSYTPGTITVEDIQKVTNGTFMAGALEDDPSKTYAQVIWEAAETYKMNPYVAVGMIRQEQGINGNSSLISGKISGYEGLYNYFNIGAYAAGGMSVTEHGLWWARGASNNATTYSRPWKNREASIKGGVEYSVSNFIAVGQDTFYYMDYNVYNNTKYDLYDHQYATNVQDCLGKGRNMADAYFDINDVEIDFRIPVFTNMPNSTALPPSGTNNDCYLSALTVENFEISGFDRYKNSYELIVPNSAKTVNVIAEKSNSDATVSGDGNRELSIGANELDIKVTSSSGVENVYKISVYREEGEDKIPEPTLNTDYDTKDYLTGVQPKTSVVEFIDKLGVKNGTVKIFDVFGNEKTGGLIATADIAYVYDLNGVQSLAYTVVIYGDTNMDGEISSIDLLVGQKHILKVKKINGAQYEAADVDHDSSIKSVDLLVTQKHILKIKSIIQSR